MQVSGSHGGSAPGAWTLSCWCESMFTEQIRKLCYKSTLPGISRCFRVCTHPFVIIKNRNMGRLLISSNLDLLVGAAVSALSCTCVVSDLAIFRASSTCSKFKA